MFDHVRVLVADDDPELLDAVARAFELMGADVVRASTGAELIEHLADDDPGYGLVVTDVSMPWMNGLQAMHAARNAGLGMPVILMTALEHAWIPAQLEALGANALLLRKPFELRELRAAAEKLLSRGQAQMST